MVNSGLQRSIIHHIWSKSYGRKRFLTFAYLTLHDLWGQSVDVLKTVETRSKELNEMVNAFSASFLALVSVLRRHLSENVDITESLLLVASVDYIHV